MQTLSKITAGPCSGKTSRHKDISLTENLFYQSMLSSRIVANTISGVRS